MSYSLGRRDQLIHDLWRTLNFYFVNNPDEKENEVIDDLRFILQYYKRSPNPETTVVTRIITHE